MYIFILLFLIIFTISLNFINMNNTDHSDMSQYSYSFYTYESLQFYWTTQMCNNKITGSWDIIQCIVKLMEEIKIYMKRTCA